MGCAISNIADFLLITSIESDHLVFYDVDFDDTLGSFVYIPKEHRMAHSIGCHLTINTIELNLDKKTWVFQVVSDVDSKIHVVVEVNYVNDVVEEDIHEYMLLFQMCFNGDMETQDNLDIVGVLTGVSVWRCAYCAGMFGKTFQECLAHENQCGMNPNNKPVEQEGLLDEF